MPDFFRPMDDDDFGFVRAGFGRGGGVDRGDGCGSMLWAMRPDAYTIEVAVNVSRITLDTHVREFLMLVVFDDDTRHPIGLDVLGWEPQRIISTARALYEFRERKRGTEVWYR